MRVPSTTRLSRYAVRMARTVGMVAGVIERRRPLAVLRASGLRLGECRRILFLETAAAMLVTVAVGVGVGPCGGGVRPGAVRRSAVDR